LNQTDSVNISDFCGGRSEKNPRCSPATGISRKKETNYTFDCTYFRPNVGQTAWKDNPHCRGATRVVRKESLVHLKR